MPLRTMSEHHKICPKAVFCDLCFDIFPIELIKAHLKCCKALFKDIASDYYKQTKDKYYVSENKVSRRV